MPCPRPRGSPGSCHSDQGLISGHPRFAKTSLTTLSNCDHRLSADRGLARLPESGHLPTVSIVLLEQEQRPLDRACEWSPWLPMSGHGLPRPGRAAASGAAKPSTPAQEQLCWSPEAKPRRYT